MDKAIGSTIVFIGLAVAGAGCEFMPDPEFTALDDALALSITGANRSDAAGFVDFDFLLQNHGDTPARACLGPSRSVSYQAGSRGGTSSTFVDHPGCTREFTIEPNGTMSWGETLEVPYLSTGRVLVTVEVQVVNPRRCNSWGSCAAIDLTSNEIVVP